MPTDIVFPDNNEKDFVEIATRLGYSKLYFAYDARKNPPPSDFQSNIVIKQALLAAPGQVPRSKQQSDLVMVNAGDDVRKVIEKIRPNLIFGVECSTRKDFMHYRNSGLNHYLCSLMHNNRIILGISMSSLLRPEKVGRPVLLGRVSQNISLCRKYKAKFVLASFAHNPYQMRSPHDLVALGISLGMNPKEAKESVEF